MSCTNFTRCAPDGTPVEVVIAADGTATYLESDGLTPWTGDPSTLDVCSTGGPDTTVEITGASASTAAVAGGTEVTVTLTAEDDGDADPATHSFAFTVPSPPTIVRYDIDYCEFDDSVTNAPRVVTCAGQITDAVLVTTLAPTGAEVFEVHKNGSSIGTINLASGATTASLGGLPETVAAGDVIELVMVSSAAGASGVGSLAIVQECA